MPDYVITQKDLRDAEAFLVEFQSEKVPEANLEKGGAVRDILIKGFTYLYAFLRGEIDRVAARQSLIRIQEDLTDDDDIAQAVDEILSNWFITRKGGQKARITARLHFNEKRDISIPLSSRFWRTNAIVFYVDAEIDPYVIPESSMLPVFDSSGTVIDYVIDVPMIAALNGEGYNIEPGKFVRIQVPGGLPFFSYAENTETSSGGKNIESTSELIERADTAIAVRNLINNRSCDATLQEEFPEIIDTLTIGMGEAEMVRDRRTEIAKHIRLHTGGHYDTYVGLDLVTVEENLTIGGFFYRPDNIINVFRDPLLTYGDGTPGSGQTFTSLGVEAGHILYLRDGIIGAPRGFVIVNVDDHELHVSEYTPFVEATDEKDPTENAVLYSIGWYGPDFEDIPFAPGIYSRTAQQSTDPDYEAVPWGTSRRIQQPGKVVLSGKPVQDISWVELTDPDGSMSSLTDPSTGTIIFQSRVNYPPSEQADPAYTEYQFSVLNPEKSQSMEAVNIIDVGYTHTLPNPPGVPNHGVFDGKNLRVVYSTLRGFSNIHDYVVNRTHRVAAANHLLRARHPIWIEIHLPYRMSDVATGSLDEDAAAIALANYINNFNPNDTLDLSDIQTSFRVSNPEVGASFPPEIHYYLQAPDGQIVEFSTNDIISIFMSDTNSVSLENSADITPPPDLIQRGITQIITKEDLADWFNYVGISNRTVQYRATQELITFVLRN